MVPSPGGPVWDKEWVMVTDQMMSRLATEPVLGGLDERDLLALLAVMEEVHLPKDRVLTWEETSVREFGIVLEGTLGVYIGAARERSLAAGDVFGAAELRGDKCWRHSLVTDEPVRALVAGWGHFNQLVTSNTRFAELLGSEPLTPAPQVRRRFGWARSRVVQPGFAG
ncbi:MAG: hypothetical protein NVSMB12_19460 [Acidimicrobiales bacterium]